MYKRCILEKIVEASKAFVIAYSDPDDYIKVSPFPVFICSGSFYYEDGTAVFRKYNDDVREYLSPEFARTVISNYADGDNLTLCFGTCRLNCPDKISEEQEQEQNERLHAKLTGLTWREYMCGRL